MTANGTCMTNVNGRFFAKISFENLSIKLSNIPLRSSSTGWKTIPLQPLELFAMSTDSLRWWTKKKKDMVGYLKCKKKLFSKQLPLASSRYPTSLALDGDTTNKDLPAHNINRVLNIHKHNCSSRVSNCHASNSRVSQGFLNLSSSSDRRSRKDNFTNNLRFDTLVTQDQGIQQDEDSVRMFQLILLMLLILMVTTL